MNKKVKRKHIKHKIKDSVFTSLFRIPKYKVELYKSLNPKDKDVTIMEHKKEVRDMLSILYDEDYLTESYDNEMYNEGMQQGIQQGITQGREKERIEIFNRLV